MEPEEGTRNGETMNDSRAAKRRSSNRIRYTRPVIVLTLALLIPFSGSYTYHVYQIGGAVGRELGNQPASEWKHKTLHALFWGVVRHDLPVDNCQLVDGERFGIEEIKIDSNFAYLLAAAVTLGIWVPLDVSWRCARAPVSTDTLR